MADPKHKFANSHLYKNITLVAWDPSPYSGNLEKVSKLGVGSKVCQQSFSLLSGK